MIRYVKWPSENVWPDGQLLFTVGEEGSFRTESVSMLYEAGVGESIGIHV